MSINYAEFVDRTVIVTGAAAGIGRAIALAFVAQGARVAALDHDARGLETLQSAASAGAILPLAADVTVEAELVRATDRVVAEIGAPRALVNNAGIDDRRAFDELTSDDWRAALAVNLDHHFILSQQVVPHMRGAGGGAIVNMSSTAFMKLASNLTSYHAAKAGIIGLTRGLARELGPLGIRVNAVAPGRVVTERVKRDKVTPEWEQETKTLQCLPELIEPADIAQGVVWLASSGARLVTGQTLVIDGGVV